MFSPVIERIRRILRPEAEACAYGLVLSGGGARAAYQAGVLHYVAEAFPAAHFPILCGISAGAINAAHIANQSASFAQATADMVESWRALRTEQVFVSDSRLSLLRSFLGFGPLAGNGTTRQGIVDTAPLRAFLCDHLNTEDGRLTGITSNLAAGRLRAVAVVTTNYQTGQTVTWVQGEDIAGWERPNRVGIHTELMTPARARLIECGAVTNRRKRTFPGRSVFTFAMGNRAFYDFLDDNPSLHSAPVQTVNDPRHISKNDGVVSVNATLQVDLGGACNSEHVMGRQYSGSGGQLDFVRGAFASKGGKSIIVCPSTAKGGTISRIVPKLDGPVTTPRNDTHIVVTEYGSADLKGKSLRERAEALIAIAHPDFRASLSDAASA